MRRVHIVPAVSVGLAMFLSACTTVPESYKGAAAIECPSGSDCYDEPIPVGPGGALSVEGGEFFFEITEGAETVREGEVEVTLENVGGAEHDFTIDEAFGEVTSVPTGENAPPGETATGTLQLFAGTYTYYCSVPGHRAAGMVGTLTIAPAGAAPQPGPTGTGTEGDGEAASPAEEGAEPGEEGADPSAEPAPTSIGG